jgi:hypothetical protein
MTLFFTYILPRMQRSPEFAPENLTSDVITTVCAKEQCARKCDCINSQQVTSSVVLFFFFLFSFFLGSAICEIDLTLYQVKTVIRAFITCTFLSHPDHALTGIIKPADFERLTDVDMSVACARVHSLFTEGNEDSPEQALNALKEYVGMLPSLMLCSVALRLKDNELKATFFAARRIK